MTGQNGILLTGANGAVGKGLFRLLEDSGFSVWPCVRTNEQAREWKQTSNNIVVGDLARLTKLPNGVGHIIHAAASPLSPERFESDNINATATLADLAAQSGVRSFVFFSAVSVYGNVTDRVIDENTAIQSPGAYGRSKLTGEDIVMSQGRQFVPIVLRLPGIIGAGSHRNWLSRVKADLAAGNQVNFFNGRSEFNNAVHVKDLASLCGVVVGTEREGGIYTLAAGGTLQVMDVLRLLASAMGSDSKLQELPATQASWTISSEKAIKKLGYRPMNIDRMIERFAKERL